MYNRYTPQSDGTFRRAHVPDPPLPPPPPKPQAPPPQEEAPAKPIHAPGPPPRRSAPRRDPPEGRGIGSFLRQLLPKDMDTADLMIVLLLLLMAGEDPDEQSNALLTLALYLFL